ncbi:MAG: low molecular weight phosphatase family protein [Maricaulaceae bacterium]|jgi:protein-tyrosine-phosphatase
MTDALPPESDKAASEAAKAKGPAAAQSAADSKWGAEPGSAPASVLFACNLNTIRSPMAAALMKRRFSAVHVDSCGVWPGGYTDPFMTEVMAELGPDLTAHEPRTFEELDDLSFDLIVALTEPSYERALELARTRDCEVEFWELADPSDAGETRTQRLNAYRAVRDELDRKIKERFKR